MLIMEPRKMTRKDRNKPKFQKPWESQIPIRNSHGDRIERKQIWRRRDAEPQTDISTLQSDKFPFIVISRHDSKGRFLADKALKIIKENRLCKINHYDVGEDKFVMTFKDDESAVTFKLLWDDVDE